MDWNERTDSMMKSWAQAQKDLWESWAQMLTPNSDTTPAPDHVFSQWGKAATEYMQAWMGGAANIAQTTAAQFLGAQELMLRFTDFNTRMWQAVAPKIEAGEDWEGALKETIEETSQAWLQTPANIAGIADDMGGLWQLYVRQWEQFGQPWEALLRRTPELYAMTATGDQAALQAFGEDYRDAYQRTLGRLVASPNLGIARDYYRKLQEGFDAWVTWQIAYAEYYAVLSGIWDTAFEKFTQDLLEMAEADEKVTNVRDLILLWTRGAEQVFTDTFRSEDYVLAQGKMLNATMEYRIHEREIIEELLKFYDLPTRTELDEAHRRIYELRKEIKSLKKTVAELATDGKKSAPRSAAASRSRKRSTRKKSTAAEGEEGG